MTPATRTRRLPLCVLTPELGLITETFIAWDIAHLAPGRTAVICDPPPNGASLRTKPAWTTDAPTLAFKPLAGDPPPDADRIGRVREFLAAHGVEVVLIQYLDLAARWITALAELPVRVWARGHGVDASAALGNEALVSSYRLLEGRARVMVPNAAAAARLTARAGLRPESVTVIPNHVDAHAIRCDPPPASGSLNCLQIGRFVRKKGHAHLLRAVSTARDAGHDVRLDLVGDGPLRGELEALAAALRITRHVRFLGSVAHPTLIDRLCRYDLLVHPSVTAPDGDREGMPLVILEAMAAGVCILATDHDGINELITSGHNGVLTPEHDEHALTRTLSLLAQHPETRRTYGRAARATVLDRYSDAVWLPAKRALLGLAEREPSA